jgi:hypothetical protein
MTYGHPPWGDGGSDTGPPLTDFASDVPVSLEMLPDGREALVYGDVLEAVPRQGDNAFGFEQTCGLCACADVLRQMGVEVSEDDVVRQAVATDACSIKDLPADSGGTGEDALVRLLSDFGVPAHAERLESTEDLATVVEQGRGAIISANAGLLWDDGDVVGNGGADHAVHVVRVARDPLSGEVLGFFVNDSGLGGDPRWHDAAAIQEAWLGTGGSAVLTDVIRPDAIQEVSA